MFSLFKSKPSPPKPAPGAAVGYSSDLIDPKVMEQIGYLELLSRTVVDGLLAGKHRSTTKGGCSEFSQHRQYAPGDEIRQIDWQVFARNDRYFIKQFEEETNLHAIMALDTSGSMKFGLSTVSKLDYARQAAACISRMLLRQRDAAGTEVVRIRSDKAQYNSQESIQVVVRLTDSSGKPVVAVEELKVIARQGDQEHSAPLVPDDLIPGQYVGEFKALPPGDYQIEPTGEDQQTCHK